MPQRAISSDLQNFLIKHFDSIAEIEALLLLRREPAETWDVASTAKRLYIDEPEAAEILTRLCEDGLLDCAGDTYRFQCRTPDLEELVERLAETYKTNLIGVTSIIHSKPRRLREFANAFKLRKDRG